MIHITLEIMVSPYPIIIVVGDRAKSTKTSLWIIDLDWNKLTEALSLLIVDVITISHIL